MGLSKKSKGSPRAEPVELRREGQYVSVCPPVAGLAEAFSTVRHLPHPDSGRVRAAPWPLVWPLEDHLGRPPLQTFAGLEPLLAAWLGRHGHAVVKTGRRPPRLREPDAGRLEAFGGVIDRGVLDLVRHRDRGLICHGPAVDPVRLVAQIALAWCRTRILVLATRRRDAAAVADGLRTFVPRVSVFAGRCPARAGRVAVATPGYARAGALGLERRGVIVALDPADLFAARELANPVDVLRRAWSARLFGLLPAGAGLPPHTRSLVTALFGPDRVCVPRPGRAPRGVDVAFVRVEGGPRVRDDGPIQLWRSGVWQHPVRNRRLARLAGLVAAGQLARVRGEFPLPVGVTLRRPGGRVVLLAANVEHALALAGRLPPTPICCGEEACLAGLPPGRRLLPTPDGAAGDGPLVIATAAGLPAVGAIDVLVRADAGHGLPPLADDHLDVPHGASARLLVVDAADRHHPALRAAARGRRAAYQRAGWTLAGEPEEAPLDQFLAARPGVMA